MAKSSKPGESLLLSVVRKENAVSESIHNEPSNAADKAQEASSKMMQDIAEQIRLLKEQVQGLQASTTDVAAQAGKVVASGARVAGDKISAGARNAGEKVAGGARIAGEKVSSTVETYPVSALLIASAAAFLIGRATASSYRPASTVAESTLDQLRQRLGDLSSRLPPHLKSALRSTLR